jgi:hypothetical protein
MKKQQKKLLFSRARGAPLAPQGEEKGKEVKKVRETF